METIRISDLTIEVIPPYKRMRWSEVEEGQLVYTAGSHGGEFVAYGPFRVIDKRKKFLRSPNAKTRGFMEPFDMLLVKD